MPGYVGVFPVPWRNVSSLLIKELVWCSREFVVNWRVDLFGEMRT
jgi:hypothetical protein